MNRSGLEHILRASKSLTGESEFIVIGSQSILGSHPDAPRVLRQSIEADLFPKHKPDLSPLIEGNLGELSPFHQTFGYYADGVGPETAVLPEGWSERLVKVCNENTGGATGWCLDPHDLAISKMAARRDKDVDFVAGMLHFKIVKPSKLEKLIRSIADEALRSRLEEALVICRRHSLKIQ